MKISNFLIITILIIQFDIIFSQIRFDSYQVFRLIPHTRRQLNKLVRLRVDYDFWSDARALNVTVDVMVPPELTRKFESVTEDIDIKPRLLIRNVQALIDNESRFGRMSFGGPFDWKSYQTLSNINIWLNSLAEKYPQIVTVVKGGTSYEKRDILGIKISYKSGNKAVFVEGGSHAREWISPAVVTYIANELLSSDLPEIRTLAENRDWYFFPVINPDGYEYTLTNRLWKKNRKPYENCMGVDLNRNWDYKWVKGDSNESPCSEYYAGPHAFSEIEAQSLSEFITSLGDRLEAFIAFHSFDQALIYPFGDDKEISSNAVELSRIGKNAVKALSQKYGTQYRVGSAYEIYNEVGGSSMDWVSGTLKQVRLVYTYELRDNGTYGFILPRDQIIPTGQETFDSFVSIFKDADSSDTA